MKIKISNIEFNFYIATLAKRTGICSMVYNKSDKHSLLYDFDNVLLDDIINSLIISQHTFNLPEIHIIQTSKNHYHAYCFTARTFRETVNILSDNPFIDMDYLRIGATRGYYTLRISPKNNENKFELVKILKSDYTNEIDPFDITVNEYWTSNIK